MVDQDKRRMGFRESNKVGFYIPARPRDTDR